jgi:tRNA(Leu) C34 or U34 (ribose-2'-O)-methylase TrmL
MGPAQGLLPKIRGFAAIGLVNPKNKINVGGVLRAAYCFDAAFVAVEGLRYTRSATDTTNTAAGKPLFHTDDIFSLCPFDCEPVAVELLDGATPLDEIRHTPRMFYIFGAEDQTLGRRITDRCSRTIVIPSRMCLNLAAAVNVVLYDRVSKALRDRRRNPEAKSDGHTAMQPLREAAHNAI